MRIAVNILLATQEIFSLNKQNSVTAKCKLSIVKKEKILILAIVDIIALK